MCWNLTVCCPWVNRFSLVCILRGRGCVHQASYFVADMSECVKQKSLRGLATLAQGRTHLNMAGGEKEEPHDFGATSYLELLRGLATCAEFIALRSSLWLLGRCHVLIGTRCSLMFYEKKYAKKT